MNSIEIIKNAKNILLSKLREKYLSFENEATVKEKIFNMEIIIISPDEFDHLHKKMGGKGIKPAAFCYKDVVYIQKYNNYGKDDFHNLIHEMLHSISSYYDDNGYKVGLLVGNKEKNYSYGIGFNEACTEYLTSQILNDDFTGYSKDLNYIIQIFMLLCNISEKQLFNYYINEEEWLTENLINSFNSDNDDLIGLVIEYDNRVRPNKRTNYENVMMYIFNAIKNAIKNNKRLDTNSLIDLLSEYNNYFYDHDINLKESTKKNMADIFDMLGMYKVQDGSEISL